jgi:hypothetical protein
MGKIVAFLRKSEQEQYEALHAWAQAKEPGESLGETCNNQLCPLYTFFQEMEPEASHLRVYPLGVSINGKPELLGSFLESLVQQVDRTYIDPLTLKPIKYQPVPALTFLEALESLRPIRRVE